MTECSTYHKQSLECVHLTNERNQLQGIWKLTLRLRANQNVPNPERTYSTRSSVHTPSQDIAGYRRISQDIAGYRRISQDITQFSTHAFTA